MNFIERWFGISPDVGDGSIEIMVFLVVFWIMTALAWHLLFAKSKTKRDH